MSVVMMFVGFIDYKVVDIILVVWGCCELIIVELEMFVLMGLCCKYVGQQLLKGVKIFGCIYMIIQIGVLIEILVVLGVEVCWLSCNIFFIQDQVVVVIVVVGILVFVWKGEIEEEYEWCIEQIIFKDGQLWDVNMVLDDGGDLIEILYKKYLQMFECIYGIIEEIIIGVYCLFDMFKNGILKVLVINVNDLVIKSKNDNKYGCCYSFNDVIKCGIDYLLLGKQVLVIGYGDVGKGFLQLLCQEGMIVKVVEVDLICVMQVCMDGFEVVLLYKNGINDGIEVSIDVVLLGKIDLIVIIIGNVNVCDVNMFKVLKKCVVVCNIGYFDNEIDIVFMCKNWVWEEVKLQVYKIYCIGKDGFDVYNDDYLIFFVEGCLVNLGNVIGYLSWIMDGFFVNQVLVQIYLFEQKYVDLLVVEKVKCLSVEVLLKKFDEEVVLEMVKGFGGVVI